MADALAYPGCSAEAPAPAERHFAPSEAAELWNLDIETIRGLSFQKTGAPVYVPLPPFVVDALEACARISECFWFWTGVGSKETPAGNWRRTFRRLCEVAGVRDGHPHRFRDTLAVELLLDGMPMERVSILLGHSSVKITERQYVPWVRAHVRSNSNRTWSAPGGTTPFRKGKCFTATRRRRIARA